MTEHEEWLALPMEEKNRILRMERWTDRVKMTEASVTGLMGLIENSGVHEDEQMRFREYLREILKAVHDKYDEAIGCPQR